MIHHTKPNLCELFQNSYSHFTVHHMPMELELVKYTFIAQFGGRYEFSGWNKCSRIVYRYFTESWSMTLKALSVVLRDVTSGESHIDLCPAHVMSLNQSYFFVISIIWSIMKYYVFLTDHTCHSEFYSVHKHTDSSYVVRPSVLHMQNHWNKSNCFN